MQPGCLTVSTVRQVRRSVYHKVWPAIQGISLQDSSFGGLVILYFMRTVSNQRICPGRSAIVKRGMQFLRRNRYLLCFAAVLVLSSVMVLKQFLANESAHVEMREDFLLLSDRGEVKSSERLYQLLIQQLPDLNDKSLVDDLERTAMLLDPKTPAPDSLVWKFNVSVKNELRNRAEQRVARALERAQK